MIALQGAMVQLVSHNFLPTFTYDCPGFGNFTFTVWCLVGSPVRAGGSGFRLLFDSMGNFVFPRQ